MLIPKYAKSVAEKLNISGFEAYFVGGCVRDALMGICPHDFDITTNASPGEIKSVFSDFKTILTGEKHGTVTVVSEGENIEVTTYRIDGEYTDSRHPEKVCFTKNIEDDLARRDFTMNAIAYRDCFVDPYEGKRDIENKIIRTVGDADKRFKEDALRIMRALRFAATLGFEIEEKTGLSIHKNAYLLKNISVERIYTEFSKLIMGKYAEKILIEYADVIGIFAPCIKPCIGFDQQNKYHIYDVYTHMVKAMCSAPFDLKIRLATLFHDVAKPDCFTIDEKGGHFKGHSEKSAEKARELFDFLKIDNETKNTAVMLIEEHQRTILPEKKYVKRFLSKFSYEFFDMLTEVMRADTLAHSLLALPNLEAIEKIKELKDEIVKDNDCVSLKSLAVNGKDLINMGITDGKKIGEILKALLEKVIDGEVENDKEQLIKIVKAL
ncbi:MAG: HD domain-containing protein [Clostridia bacterium]|nr:HD domain-containing protein [Clostridia bacterium]